MAIAMNPALGGNKRTTAIMSTSSLAQKSAPQPEPEQEPEQQLQSSFPSSLELLSSIATMMSDDKKHEAKWDADTAANESSASGTATSISTSSTSDSNSNSNSNSNPTNNNANTSNTGLKRKRGGLTRSLTKLDLTCEAALDVHPRSVRRPWQSQSTPAISSMEFVLIHSSNSKPSTMARQTPKPKQQQHQHQHQHQQTPAGSSSHKEQPPASTKPPPKEARVQRLRRRLPRRPRRPNPTKRQLPPTQLPLLPKTSGRANSNSNATFSVYRSYEMLLPKSSCAGHILPVFTTTMANSSHNQNKNNTRTVRRIVDDYNYEITDCNPLRNPPRLPNPNESFSIAERSLEERNTWGWYA
eukprot:jgi/Psemu1/293261/fgenesh1_pg.1943_\